MFVDISCLQKASEMLDREQTPIRQTAFQFPVIFARTPIITQKFYRFALFGVKLKTHEIGAMSV